MSFSYLPSEGHVAWDSSARYLVTYWNLCLAVMVMLRSSKISPLAKDILFSHYSTVSMSMEELGPVVVIQGGHVSLSMVLSDRKVLFFINN